MKPLIAPPLQMEGVSMTDTQVGKAHINIRQLTAILVQITQLLPICGWCVCKTSTRMFFVVNMSCCCV